MGRRNGLFAGRAASAGKCMRPPRDLEWPAYLLSGHRVVTGRTVRMLAHRTETEPTPQRPVSYTHLTLPTICSV
eukprot:8928702-Prorocentrum_lima.AAC.1